MTFPQQEQVDDYRFHLTSGPEARGIGPAGLPPVCGSGPGGLPDAPKHRSKE